MTQTIDPLRQFTGAIFGRPTQPQPTPQRLPNHVPKEGRALTRTRLPDHDMRTFTRALFDKAIEQ